MKPPFHWYKFWSRHRNEFKEIAGHLRGAYRQLRRSGCTFGPNPGEQWIVAQVIATREKYRRLPWYWQTMHPDRRPIVTRDDGIICPMQIRAAYIKIPSTRCLLLLCYYTGKEYIHDGKEERAIRHLELLQDIWSRGRRPDSMNRMKGAYATGISASRIQAGSIDSSKITANSITSAELFKPPHPARSRHKPVRVLGEVRKNAPGSRELARVLN
jgi:hypothetical protein